MKNKFIDPFTCNLPSIDLHGYDRDSARVQVKDFINDNYRMKNDNFYIIHGVGSGVIRKATIDVLKHDKRVLEYKISNPNIGCTTVWLKIDK